MKLIFSILLLFTLKEATCREIIVISYKDHLLWALKIVKIIQEDLHIPAKLISIKWAIRPCLIIPESIVHICLNEEGMNLIRVNPKVIRKSFSIF